MDGRENDCARGKTVRKGVGTGKHILLPDRTSSNLEILTALAGTEEYFRMTCLCGLALGSLTTAP